MDRKYKHRLVSSASLLAISSTNLTFFSKFFSSFPHGTCSLSVSRWYLALDEIYHQFWAAFPSNSTRWTLSVRNRHQVKDGILTLYDTLFQKIYTWAVTGYMSLGYNSLHCCNDFHFELFPLHSPLLRESLLVSFPPLNNMLKSRGSSYFIWDLMLRNLFKHIIL